jgi:hypothetical protein
VEASRGRALKHEIQTQGLSERARRLLRDPVAWTAKATTWTLMLAVMFVMSTKPPAWGCALSLVIALLVGAMIAVPMWRGRATQRATPKPPAQAQAAGARYRHAEPVR